MWAWCYYHKTLALAPRAKHSITVPAISYVIGRLQLLSKQQQAVQTTIDPDTNSSFSRDSPPAAWTCDPDAYYEVSTGSLHATCDCGCGATDPDCGYVIHHCDHQLWNPPYTELKCDGVVMPMDLMYCRLESHTCQGSRQALTGS